MLEQAEKVRISGGVTELSSQKIEHSTGAFGVHVLLLELPGELLFVLVPHHLEKVEVPVERLVLVLSQLVDDGLDAEHQQLVSQMQAELERHLARSVVEHCVDERHDRRLQRQIVLVDPKVLIEVVDYRLEARSLGMVPLEVQHGLEDLAVTARHQADRAEDLQHGDLGLYVLSRQRLRYRVDCRWMRQHVCSAVLKSKISVKRKERRAATILCYVCKGHFALCI